MNKITIFFIFAFICSRVSAQNSGLLKGLSYTHDFQKDIENERRQEQLDMQAQQMYEERLRAANKEKIERAQACADQIKELYPTFANYPDHIVDGWYNVAVTNYYDMCGERKVYVSSNKVVKYFIDNYDEREIAYSSLIENGKAHIKFNIDGKTTEIHDVYFLENIIDPKATASKPVVGKFSFYTNFKRAGEVNIYVDNKFCGTLDSYFPDNGTPLCGQESGTVTFTYKPGTYYFAAKSESHSWSGQITIVADDCRMMNLTK